MPATSRRWSWEGRTFPDQQQAAKAVADYLTDKIADTDWVIAPDGQLYVPVVSVTLEPRDQTDLG
jgi:hypothetical protein